MEFYDVIKNRTCIRRYKPGQISRKTLEKLVDAGRRAPTARAVEPWEFVVIQDKGTLEVLSSLATNGRFVCEAQAAILVFCKNTKYYLEDGSAATENILLAAAHEQLGACWIAGDKKDYAREVSELVKASQDMKLVSIISVGIGDEPKIQDKNRELENVIHWETF
jgi:nitroreductase